MKQDDNSTKDINHKLEISKKFQISANIATILGILVSVTYYLYITDFNREQEKRKNAIEAIGKIYNNEFLNKYAIIFDSEVRSKDEQINAFYYVLNTYYIISIIYNNNIGDRLIITKAIEQGIQAFTSSLVYKQEKHNIENTCKECVDEIDKMIKNFGEKE